MDFFNRLWNRGQGLLQDLEKYRRKIRNVEIKFSASNLELSDNGTATVTLTALIIRTWPFYSNFLGDNERVVWGGGMRNQNGGSVVIENPDRISTRAVISNWTGTRRFTMEVRDANGVKRAEGEIVVTAAQNSNAALILNVDFTDAQYSPNRSWEQNFPQGSEPRRYPGRPIPGEPIGDGLGILDEQLLLIKRNNRPGEYSQYMAIPDRMRLCRFIGRPDINYGLWRNKKFKLHVDFVCEDFMTEETVFVFTDYWPSYGYEDEKATEVGTESIVNPKWSWGFCKIKLQNGNIYGRIMKRLESRFNHTDLRREEMVIVT